MPVNYDQLTRFRKLLHANPELSGQEKGTAQRIAYFLTDSQPDVLRSGIGGHGLLASWGERGSGPEIIFRAELDALPIMETNSFGHRSKTPGVSHKCGHDGHSAILCGLAQFLSANRPQNSRVSLLFQAAEENGEGAKAMLDDPFFRQIRPSYLFALHNLPGYPLHEIVVKENNFTAAVNSMIIRLEGKTAHAAEPEHGINPALALAQILKECSLLEYNFPEREDLRVVTPVFAELGEKAYGISAGRAEVHFTLRCWDDKNLRKLEQTIELLVRQIAENHGLQLAFDYTQSFHANVNDPIATAFVRRAANAGGYSVTERGYPFKWGEDFGLFTSRYRGCMFGIGSGEQSPALHNPDYDFPDALIKTGVTLFSSIVKEIQRDN